MSLLEVALATDDEDLLLIALALADEPDNPEGLVIVRAPIMKFKFYLDLLTDDTCIVRFRFLSADIRRMAHAFHLPDKMTLPRDWQAYSTSGVEAMCIALQRLAHPGPLALLCAYFGCGLSCIEGIFNDTCAILEARFAGILDFDRVLLLPNLQLYSESIALAGSPLLN